MIILYTTIALLFPPVIYLSYRLSGNILLPYIMLVKALLILFIISLMCDGSVALAAGDISLMCAGIVMLSAAGKVNCHRRLVAGYNER